MEPNLIGSSISLLTEWGIYTALGREVQFDRASHRSNETECILLVLWANAFALFVP